VSIEANGENGLTFDYSYIGNKITTIEVSNGQSLKFYYTGNLITKTEKYLYNDTELSNEIIYQYDDNERLVSEESKDFLNSVLETREYSYESNGTVSYLFYAGEIGSVTVLAKTGTYFFNANNEVIKLEDISVGSNEMITTNFTYDTNNSIFKNVLGWNKIFSTVYDGKTNNILTATTINADDIVIYGYTNQYSYNNAGYPVALTTLIDGNAATVNYFY
jgi:acetyltransferase-like isoleucine patch superfamily enzyme